MTCAALVVISLIIMAIAAVAIVRLPPEPKPRKVAIGVVLALAALTFNVGVGLSVAASRAGFPTLYDTTIAQVAQVLTHDKKDSSTRLSDPTVSQALHALSYGIEDSSPMCLTEPVLPEHTVAVLFRYDCSDCTATLNDLKAWANKTNVRVIFVSSRMPGGKRLAEAAHVTEVPSVVCVNPSTGEFVWRVAYKTVDGSARIDENNLDTITKIATNKREV